MDRMAKLAIKTAAQLLIAPLLIVSSPLFAQSYKKIHAKAIVVDMHNDIATRAIERQLKFDSDLKGKSHSDLNRFKEGGVDVQFFSIFCVPEQQQPYAFANREIDSVYEWVRRNPDKMMIVKTLEQLQQALKEKKLAAMMGMEGGHMLEEKLENLDSLYARGIRYMTLTWNNSTSWATSAADETTKGDSLPHKGLTDFGKQIIRRMNELGMIVDISHVGEQTFWDAINTSTKPVIASHSSVWMLCPNRRNLKDEQIKAIGKNGGLINVNFFSAFIDSTFQERYDEFNKRHQKEIDELASNNIPLHDISFILSIKYASEIQSISPPLSVLLDHIDYIVKMIGVDHVGLGSDFDGIQAQPKELAGVESFPLITKALLERGYNKKDIEKILGLNFLRVFKTNQQSSKNK